MTTAKFEIIGDSTLNDPHERVRAIVAAAKAICKSVDKGPDEGVMMLLMGAVYILATWSGEPPHGLTEVLKEGLNLSIKNVEDMFAADRESVH